MIIIKDIDPKMLNQYSNDYLSLLANVRIHPTHKSIHQHYFLPFSLVKVAHFKIS